MKKSIIFLALFFCGFSLAHAYYGSGIQVTQSELDAVSARVDAVAMSTGSGSVPASYKASVAADTDTLKGFINNLNTSSNAWTNDNIRQDAELTNVRTSSIAWSADNARQDALLLTSTGFFVICSTDTNPGIQNWILNSSTYHIISAQLSTSGQVQADADIIADIIGYFTNSNTLLGQLKLKTGQVTGDIVLSTWTASKDYGIKFIVVSNTGTVKLNQINLNVKYWKETGQ
jgi:hypothetical protein